MKYWGRSIAHHKNSCYHPPVDWLRMEGTSRLVPGRHTVTGEGYGAERQRDAQSGDEQRGGRRWLIILS